MITDPTQQFISAYDTHADALFRFCYAYAGERELARDATQEAFVRTWKYLASGKRIQQIRPFLYQTARNTIIDVMRRPASNSLERMQEEGFDIQDHRGPDPAVSAQAAHVVASAARLDEKYRTAVILRHVEGMSPREIAGIVGVSENTVSVRINRGIQQLRELLGI